MSSWPRSQKGAHLIASRFRHTRWVSERIRRNGVHARTKRDIEERQKEERDEGSTDTPTSLPLKDILYIRRELPTKKKNGFNVLQSAIFLLKVCRSAGTPRRHMHPPTKPHLKTPHTKKHNFKHVSFGATHARM